jgi:hypothetical protein
LECVDVRPLPSAADAHTSAPLSIGVVFSKLLRPDPRRELAEGRVPTSRCHRAVAGNFALSPVRDGCTREESEICAWARRHGRC